MTNILLLEDDETISFGIGAALKKKGYEVLNCPSIAKGKLAFSQEIFLTVRDGAKDIIKGLDMGGDDYITKPFHLSVLESRIKAVLRRASKKAVHSPELSCGTIRINLDKMEVQIQGNAIPLTAAEYRLLLVLMENKGKTLPRTLLLEKLWDAEGNFVNDNTLTVTMKRLREKLGQPGEIKTVRGIGYRMEDTNE